MNFFKVLISKVSRQETLKKVTANFTWLLAERLLLMAVTMVVGIYVARNLGPQKYGVLNFAISFVGIFTAMAELGLANVVVKELVNHNERHTRLMGTSFLLKLAGSVVMFGAVVIASMLAKADWQESMLMYIIASGVIISSFQSIRFYFQSQVLSKYEAIARTSGMILLSVAKIVMVVMGAPLLYFGFAYLLRDLMQTISLIYFYRKIKGSIFQWSFDKSIAKSLFYDCWPIIISGLVVSIHMKIDQVMINQMIGSTEVGYYAAADKLSRVWLFLPTIIVSSVYPVLIKYKKQSDELFKKQLSRLYDVMVVLALSIAIPTSLLANWAVHIIYGPEYIKTGSVLALHIWTGLFVFMGIVRGNWSVIERQQKYNPIIQGVGAAVNVSLNFVLINTYGVIGAAAATLVTSVVNLLVTPVFINHKYREQVKLILNSLNIFTLIPRIFLYLRKINTMKSVR